MSRHVSITSSKGGVGKTLTAINLAAWYARAGMQVCLVDHDPQGSVMIFGGIAQRAGVELPFVPTNARVSGFDLYIHDHAPGIEDRYPSSVLVMPVVLDAPSATVHLRGKSVLERQGYTVLEVLSRFREDRAQPVKLRAQKYPHCPAISEYTLYSNLYGKGLTVIDAWLARQEKRRASKKPDSLDRAYAQIGAVAHSLDQLLGEKQ